MYGVLGNSPRRPVEEQLVGEGILLGQVYGWSSVLYELSEPLIHFVLGVCYIPKGYATILEAVSEKKVRTRPSSCRLRLASRECRL